MTLHNIKFLLNRLKQNDEQAFHKLFLYYADDVYAFSRSIIKSDVLAKEILQEVFLKVWENASSVDPELNFKSFLLKIARNKCLNLLKKAANDQRLSEKVFYEKSQHVSTPFDQLREKELSLIKAEAINQLPEKRKKIFLMSREHGKSYKEISSELGISINTVKVQMNKALTTLKEYLSQHSDITALFLLIYWLF